MLARIRALLRRPAMTTTSVVGLGNLMLDTIGQSVSISGIAIEVPRLERNVYSMDAEVTPNAIEAAGATVAITAMCGLG